MSKRIKLTMYMDDDEKKPVTAGGILLYKYSKTKGDYLFLMIYPKSRNLFEDIGGRVDENDKNIHETVAREVYEETNKLIKKKSIIKRLVDSPYVYVPKSKYVIYFVRANDSEKKLTSKDFGTKEIHDDIEREMKWIPRKKLLDAKFIKYDLAFRVKHKKVFDTIKQIGSKVTNPFI